MAFFDNIKDKTNHLEDKANLRILFLKLVFVVGQNRWKVDEMLNNLLGAESLSLCSLTSCSRARNITSHPEVFIAPNSHLLISQRCSHSMCFFPPVLLYCTVLDRDCKIIRETYDILWQDEEAQDTN